MRSKVAIGVCVACLLPAVAAAQPAEPSKPGGPAKPAKSAKSAKEEQAAQKAAEEHFQKGSAFFESGGFNWAIEEFDAGFQLTGESRFLFWLGRCHEDMGEKRKAVEYFQRYLAADPEGAFANDAGTHVAKLSAEIEHEEDLERERVQREAEEVRKRERQRKAVERRRELFEKALDQKRKQMLVEAEERRVEAERAAARRAHRRARFRQAGLITMGVGAVSLAVGAVYGLEAKSANDALSDHITGAWTDDLLVRQDEGESAERRMFYLSGIGAAAVVTGGILYWLGSRGARAETSAGLSVRPSVGASHAALSLAGRF
jgi:tetratricopeptide (TPR) repeat protein